MKMSYKTSPGINSICLPAPNIVNKESEYALMAGWGMNDRHKEPAQMGYMRLISNMSELLPPNHTQFKKKDYTKFLVTVTINNQTFPCKVSQVKSFLSISFQSQSVTLGRFWRPPMAISIGTSSTNWR